MPQWYIPLLLLLEMQQIVLFVIKVVAFWPVFGIHRFRAAKMHKLWVEETKSRAANQYQASIEIEIGKDNPLLPILDDLEID
jgi:hypothetical protein